MGWGIFNINHPIGDSIMSIEKVSTDKASAAIGPY